MVEWKRRRVDSDVDGKREFSLPRPRLCLKTRNSLSDNLSLQLNVQRRPRAMPHDEGDTDTAMQRPPAWRTAPSKSRLCIHARC